MELESEPLNSDSIAAVGVGGGGGAVGSEDYVHVDDAGAAADSSFFGVASITDSEWRGEENENDELLSRSTGEGGGGGGVDGGGDDERKELPEELSRSVLKLTCESTAAEGGICDVYLVGTAHVSTVCQNCIRRLPNFN